MRRSLTPAALVCLAWWALAYLPPIVAGKCAPARDLAATHYPWRAVWSSQVRSGTVPLWNPLSNGGRPMLADPNAMAAYPASRIKTPCTKEGTIRAVGRCCRRPVMIIP